MILLQPIFTLDFKNKILSQYAFDDRLLDLGIPRIVLNCSNDSLPTAKMKLAKSNPSPKITFLGNPCDSEREGGGGGTWDVDNYDEIYDFEADSCSGTGVKGGGGGGGTQSWDGVCVFIGPH